MNFNRDNKLQIFSRFCRIFIAGIFLTFNVSSFAICEQEAIAHCKQNHNPGFVDKCIEEDAENMYRGLHRSPEYLDLVRRDILVPPSNIGYERKVAFQKCVLAAYDKEKNAINVKTIDSGSDKSSEDNKNIAYFPSDKKCLRRSVNKDGYETYTNTCSTTIKFGYCHVHPRDENDITGCKAESSTFSRSGYNYITQAGGLEPGRTHTKGYAYEGTQVTFLVACRAGRSPLIESFNSKKITAASKANMSCWAFSNTKNAKGE